MMGILLPGGWYLSAEQAKRLLDPLVRIAQGTGDSTVIGPSVCRELESKGWVAYDGEHRWYSATPAGARVLNARARLEGDPT